MNFELQLSDFLALTKPFARAIKCLESSHATLSDVYAFWLGITATSKRVLQDSDTFFDEDTMNQIRGIISASQDLPQPQPPHTPRTTRPLKRLLSLSPYPEVL